MDDKDIAWDAGLLMMLGGLTGLAVKLAAVAGDGWLGCLVAFGAGMAALVTVTRVVLWFVKLVRRAVQAATEEANE